MFSNSKVVSKDGKYVKLVINKFSGNKDLVIFLLNVLEKLSQVYFLNYLLQELPYNNHI